MNTVKQGWRKKFFLYSFLLAIFPLIVNGWDPGYYTNGDKWSLCSSSCKECTTGDQCTSWEVSMIFNATTNLCEHCTFGEYYDFSMTQWRSCGSSCDGYCKASCIQWTGSDLYNLDSMSCGISWDTAQIQISDSTRFNIDKFCRSLNYYINPQSTEIIELGTKAYPYRTPQPAFDEILKFHSNNDYNISIYIKDGTTVTLQDYQNFFVNITQVNILVYTSTSDGDGHAKIITQETVNQGVSKRAKFHLHKLINFDLTGAINAGTFTDVEKKLAEVDDRTIKVFRTGIQIQGFTVKRYSTNIEDVTFLELIYQQSKKLTLSKC